MQRFILERAFTGAFNEQQRKLINNQEELLSFIDHPFSKENIIRQAERKVEWFSDDKRKELVDGLNRKYADVQISNEQQSNLTLLSKKETVTITTGHQLSLLTGPAYFIYKILHVIDLCERMNAEDDEYHYVPVFWMASEDHDFEEISSVNLFGKELKMDYAGNNAVGRIDSEVLLPVLEQFISFFREDSKEEVETIIKAYKNGKTIGECTFQLVNQLFRSYGLLIVDADDRLWKQQYSPIIKREITEGVSHALVSKTNKDLEKEGLKIQVHSREINMFSLFENIRSRILHTDEGYFIEGKGELNSEEMNHLIDEHPEQFSPNALLRPLYQEFILPNVCYVGGVGELSYWLQIKGVFDAFEVPYPLIQVRNSILWIDASTSSKMAKYGLHLEDIFKETDQVKRNFIEENEKDSIDLSGVEMKAESFIADLIEKVDSVDASMNGFVLGETEKIRKQIHTIKEKLIRNQKQKHDSAMQAIEQIKTKLFSADGLQERSMNFFALTPAGNVRERLTQLKSVIDAFETELIIVRES